MNLEIEASPCFYFTLLVLRGFSFYLKLIYLALRQVLVEKMHFPIHYLKILTQFETRQVVFIWLDEKTQILIVVRLINILIQIILESLFFVVLLELFKRLRDQFTFDGRLLTRQSPYTSASV